MVQSTTIVALLALSCAYLFSVCTGNNVQNDSDTFYTNERKLYDYLMSPNRYNKYIRPVAHEKDPIGLYFGLSMVAIEDLDEKNQVLTMHARQHMNWNDAHLTWDPADYGGVNGIRFPASHVWVPDIVPHNAVHDSDYAFAFDAMVAVESSGFLSWVPVSRLQTICPLDMHKFPFDEHVCRITFGSWTHGVQTINLSHAATGEIDMSSFEDHLEWEVVSTTGKLTVTEFPCCPGEGFPDITYEITLRRRPTFLNHVFLAPAVVLAFLIPVLFLLPPEAGEKMTLGSGIMITLMLLTIMLENFMPVSQPRVPVIGQFYLVCFVMVGISMGTSALIICTWYRSMRQTPVPSWLRLIFLSGLNRLLCVSADDFPSPENYQPGSMRQLELTNPGEGSLPGDNHPKQMIRERASTCYEWRQLAVVLDRLCFVLFFVAMVIIAAIMAH